MSGLIIFCLALFQNVLFVVVSRLRDRETAVYHALTSLFSNGLMLATLFAAAYYLTLGDLTWWLLVPYFIGAVVGSFAGAKISIGIENS